jgi:TolB protein
MNRTQPCTRCRFTLHAGVALLAVAVSFPLAAGWPATRTSAAETPALRLTSDGSFKQRPAWSPDGKHLAFARHEGDTILLYVADVLDKSGIADPGRAVDDRRSPDDPHHRSGLFALENLRRLTDRDAPEYDAVWSPDGKRLAFTLVKQSGTQGDLDVYTIAADGTDLRPFATTGDKLSHEESPAWSPDGKRIAFTSTREGNQEIFLAPSPLVPDGRPSIVPDRSSSFRRLTNDPALDAHPTWSPDGKRIAFATARWGDLEIALMDADGSHLTRLTESPGLDDYPAFSPDGRHIAFTSNRDGNFEVYLMAPDGTHPRNLTNSPALDNFPAWHPTAGLTFLSNRSAAFELYLLMPPEPLH